jgi:hypothetical protein
LNGRIGRALDPSARAEWKALSLTRFFKEFTAQGRLVDTRECPAGEISLEEPWVTALEHAPLPFISYPYEWSFSMLKDAALLQLEILEAALREDMILKDSSPFNIQWSGAHPVFIDMASFVRLQPGEPWVGYRQFCQLFLFPLMIQSYKGTPFQPWMRARLEGVTPEEMSHFFGWGDVLRPGILLDVFLQARLDAQWSRRKDMEARQELRAAGFHKTLIENNARRLKKVVNGLKWRPDASEWSDYARQRTYSLGDYESKKSFVEKIVSRQNRRLVADLGSNTGDFARLAARHADLVLALDADPWVIDMLYRDLKAEGNRRIIPLTMNLADPSPAQGWKGEERSAFLQRMKPDVVLALALLHHLSITSHIPLHEIVGWLAAMGGEVVVEFVRKEDPMVQKLLLNKTDIYVDYNQENFENLLGKTFEIREKLSLMGGNRWLYHAVPRS